MQLTSPYAIACFGHAMNKACQYTTLDDNVCENDTSVVEKCPINLVWDNNLNRQKIVAKATKSGTRVVGLLAYIHTNWKHRWKQVFANNFLFSKELWNLQMSSIFVIIDKAFNFNLRCHVGRHMHEHSNISHQLVVNNCPSFETSPPPLIFFLKRKIDFSFNCKIGSRFQFQNWIQF